jgi:hypothetical protein
MMNKRPPPKNEGRLFMQGRFLQDRRAAGTYVEAVITMPIAVLITLFVINGGMVMFAQQAVQAAARHGARMGSVAQQCPTCYAIQGAEDVLHQTPIVRNGKVTILAPGGRPGSILKVRVTGEVPNFLGRLVPLLPNPFVVKAEATFRQEGW